MIKLKKKNARIFKLTVAAGAGLLIIGSQYLFGQPARLEVDFFDVGQGDSALIKIPGGPVILIDGGPDNKVLRRLGENLPFYRRRIDYLIISHYHEDHVVGLIEVINRYKVGKIIYAPGNPPAEILRELLVAASQRGLTPQILDARATIKLGPDCNLFLLNPHIFPVKADENNSLEAKLNCGGQKFLFTGDNSAVVEKALVSAGWDLVADILKTPHHGSNTASSGIFLDAVKPKIMVISVGADNTFGHPHPAVLERAADRKIEVRRTDQAGTIKIYGPSGESP